MKTTLKITIILSLITGGASCTSHVVDKKIIDATELQFASRSCIKEWMRVPKDSINHVIVEDGTVCCFYIREKKGENHLALFDLEQNSPIREIIPYGAKKDEMLLPFLTVTPGHLFLYDPVKKEATDIEVKKALEESSFIPSFYHTSVYSQEVIPVKDRLLFLNQYSFKGKAPRVLFSDRKWNYTETKHYNFDAMNVVDGSLQYNERLDRIAYLAEYLPVIELMDGKGTLTKTIQFPHSVSDFVAVDHPNLQIVEYLFPDQASQPFPRFSFCCSDSNDEKIACAYWREDWTFVVLVLDWEGNILDGFTVETRIKNISLSSDGESVYCWEEKESECFLREYEITD